MAGGAEAEEGRRTQMHKKKRPSDMEAEGAPVYTYADLWDQVPIVEKSSENSLRSLRSLVRSGAEFIIEEIKKTLGDGLGCQRVFTNEIICSR